MDQVDKACLDGIKVAFLAWMNTNGGSLEDAFIAGAFWQQERDAEMAASMQHQDGAIISVAISNQCVPGSPNSV